jgi:hypothetical protein
MKAQDVKTVVDIGHRFGLTDVVGWCAGNEAGSAYFYISPGNLSDALNRLSLLIDIWRSMVAGPPIDDQREMRSGGRTEVKDEQEPQSPSVADAIHRPSMDSEDEEDPNDYMPQPEAQRRVEAARDGYGFDESDYGSDSD